MAGRRVGRLSRAVAWLASLTTLAALLGAPGAAAQSAASEHTVTSTTVTADDGVELAVDVFRPAHLDTTTTTPVAMVISPYLDPGPLGSAEPQLTWWVEEPDLIGAGYTVVQASLRGFARSGGCVDWGGPLDRADVRTLVEWAAQQPWSTGQVAVIGNSYEAWAGVMALAAAPEGLAAVVLYSPLIDGYRAYYMNGVRYGHVWHATPAQYAADGLRPPTGAEPAAAAEHMAAAAPHAPCNGANLAFSHVGDREAEYWAQRDLADAAANSDVPVLWTHGFLDANTKPDNILPLWERLQGTKRAWFSQMVHGGPPSARAPERDDTRLAPEVLRFLDEHVKGVGGAGGDAPVWVQDDRGRYRAEDVWPPADGEQHSWPLLDGVYSDVAGNHGEKGGPQNVDAGNEPSQVPVPTGLGSWTFTPPLPHDVHLSGTPSITVKLALPAPQATLVGLLYDVAPDGKARLISRGARLLDLGTTATLDLYPQDWVVPEGHRLGLLLSGADDTWFDPGHTGQVVQVAGGEWSAPFLRMLRTDLVQGVVIDRLVGLHGPMDRRIDVPAAVIEQRTVDAEPPPAQEPPANE